MQKPTLTIFYQFNPWQSSIGGIQTLIRTFLKYSSTEFTVQLVGTEADPKMPVGQWRTAEYAGREIRFLPLFYLPEDNSRKWLPTSVRYTAALAKYKIHSDFLHFHRLEPSLVTRRWPGEKTLFVHNDIQQQISGTQGKNAIRLAPRSAIAWRYMPGVYFALEKSLLEQFQQIYSCNSNSLSHYQQRYPQWADRMSFIRNTFDPQVCYPLAPEQRDHQRRQLAQRLQLSPNTQFLLFAGRLHPQKDPLLLLQSFAHLADPQVHLLIAGEGDLKEAVIAEIDRLHLQSQVTLLGALAQTELAHYLQISQSFVLSSVYEGLPVVVLESLACGTPVVTTPCGETPKLLTSASGVVTDDRRPESIAQALRQVLSHPECYPSSACVQAVAGYNAQTVVGQIFADMAQRFALGHNRPIPSRSTLLTEVSP